jgi:hypothetical protein
MTECQVPLRNVLRAAIINDDTLTVMGKVLGEDAVNPRDPSWKHRPEWPGLTFGMSSAGSGTRQT